MAGTRLPSSRRNCLASARTLTTLDSVGGLLPAVSARVREAGAASMLIVISQGQGDSVAVAHDCSAVKCDPRRCTARSAMMTIAVIAVSTADNAARDANEAFS